MFPAIWESGLFPRSRKAIHTSVAMAQIVKNTVTVLPRKRKNRSRILNSKGTSRAAARVAAISLKRLLERMRFSAFRRKSRITSLSDIEWTRDYHILRRDGAHIDGIGESLLNDHFGSLVLNRFEENRIEVSFAASTTPRQNPVLARRNAGDRKDTELIRRGGPVEIQVFLTRRYQNNGAVGNGFVL